MSSGPFYLDDLIPFFAEGIALRREEFDLVREPFQHGGRTAAASGVLIAGGFEAAEREAGRDEGLGEYALSLCAAPSAAYGFDKEDCSHDH